jgi:GxxExxY protein
MGSSEKDYLAEEGFALMGAVFEVHRELGAGLSEEIYQESLELELGFRGIRFETKAELKVFYKGKCLTKRYIPDLQISQEIIVELKSVKILNSEHEHQLLNYMHVTQKAVGYLINFRPSSVEWKRFILEQYVPTS